MLYLATASGPKVRDAMANGLLGQIITPRTGNRLVPGVSWALDNARVILVDERPATDPKWSERRWIAKLAKHMHDPGCLFAAVPDEVGDAAATDVLWRTYAPVVMAAGYRPAYVTQNGCERVPGDAGAVFTGGDDAWKEGADARALVAAARARGTWTHMGRVNSLRRLRIAMRDGYDSVDGTYLSRGPDTNLPKLLSYLRTVDNEALQGALFAPVSSREGDGA